MTELMRRRRALMGQKNQKLLSFVPGAYYSNQGVYVATVGNDRVALYDGELLVWNYTRIPFDGTLSFSAGDVITWKLVLVSGSSFSFFGNMYFGSKAVADNVTVKPGFMYSYTATMDVEAGSFCMLPRVEAQRWSNAPRGILVEIYINGKQVA